VEEEEEENEVDEKMKINIKMKMPASLASRRWHTLLPSAYTGCSGSCE